MVRAATLATCLLLASCDAPPQQQAEKQVVHESNPEVGRYVVVHSPHVERDTILLDTVTGKTWQLTQYTFLKDDPVGWEPMARGDDDDEYKRMVTSHGLKQKK